MTGSWGLAAPPTLIKDTSGLPYNEGQAVIIARSMRNHLHKKECLEEYENELRDYLDRGVIIPLTKTFLDEKRKEGKPVCFASHHPVIRPEKATSKVRLVSNSSLPIGGKGNLSANEYP